MRKITAIILSMGIMGSLVACGGNTTANTSAPESSTEMASDQGTSGSASEVEADAAAGGNKTIAGVVFQEDQFFKLMSTGYEAAAKDLGYEIQLSNITNDQTKETEIVNTYTAQGVAGIAISPLSATISPEALKESSGAGVKICVANTTLDAYPFAVSAFTSDNFSFCHQTGEIAAAFIKENYAADETVKLGILQFKTQIPETSAERVAGFKAALDEAGVNYEVVADQDAWLQDMAVGKVGDMLAANPDIDILFAANDGGTIGSVMAVENAGLAGKVFVFGTDASEQMVDLLKSDTNILQAVTGQDPYAIGYKTVETLVAAIEGKATDADGKTVIIEGIPLERGDNAKLDEYLADLKSKM